MKHVYLAVIACHLFSYQNSAQPAAFDVSFANNGIGLYTIPNESANASSRFSFLQANGKLILGGSIDAFLGLVRIKQDGTIDAAFGSNGKILTVPPTGPAGYVTGAMQADGKFLIAGTNGNDMVVLRYLASGAPDKTFNGNGQQTIAVNDGIDRANAIALQPDGKIIVAGYSFRAGNELFSIARLNENGSFDNTFDTDGKKSFGITNSGGEECRALAVQADGKILLAGTSPDVNGNAQFSIARLNTDGSFDNTFNGSGKQTILVAGTTGHGYENAIALQSNGKILLAGRCQFDDLNRDNNMAVVRLNQNGTPDNNFDGDGIVIIALAPGAGWDEATAIAVDANEKIVVGGYSHNGTDDDYAVARLNRNGSFDLSFDGDGTKTIPVGSYSDIVTSMIITADKIILAGYSGDNHPTTPNANMISDLLHYSVARLNFDGSLDNSFDGDGKNIFETGSLNDEVNASDIGPNGGILIGGSSLKKYGRQAPGVMRLTATGQPDNNFSDDGRLLLEPNFPAANDGNNYAVLRVAGGNIMLAGETNSSQTGTHDFLITRLTSAGIPDASFGVAGYATVNINGTDDTATCMAIQADGKIVVAGCTSSFLNGTIISVARLLSNGTPDNSFGTNGKKTITAGFGASKVYSICIQTDGKILLAGFSAGALTGNYDFTVLRLNTNGSSDNTFGSGGKATISMSNFNDICYSMKLQADGKIVIAGAAGSESSKDFAVARLNANGSLDNTFDGDGKRIIPLGSGNDIAKSVALQQDGKIILAGYSYDGKDNDASIIRLNADGSLDNGFDGDGKAIFDMPGTDEMINVVNIQVDGKIVLAGKQRPGVESYGSSYFVMRLMGGNSPNNTNNDIAAKTADRSIDAALGQNFPNPFFNTTAIYYTLPQTYSSAKILVVDKAGKILKEINISGSGKGSLQVDASTLASGAYHYSLYVDGKLIGTKQMEHIK